MLRLAMRWSLCRPPCHAMPPADPPSCPPSSRVPAGFNTLLRYMDPLLISLACNMEPLIGSLLGWALGLVAPPGAWTYVGGGLVLASTCVVSLASHCREKRQAAADKGGGAATPALGGSRGLGHAAAAPPAEGGGELLGLRAAHGDSPSGGPRSKAPAAAPAGPPPSAV